MMRARKVNSTMGLMYLVPMDDGDYSYHSIRYRRVNRISPFVFHARVSGLQLQCTDRSRFRNKFVLDIDTFVNINNVNR